MSSTIKNDLATHIHAVQQYASLTAPRYRPLLETATQCHPIPCFGSPARALAVTVGLNPSATEFKPGRSWSTPLSAGALADRCASYFTSQAPCPPHPWFKTWAEALGWIGLRYEDGSAVHIDISPRSTRSVSSLATATNQALFLEMVERDLWTFFATLQLCQAAKLVLLAGSVTGKYYMNEFLERLAPTCGYTLDRPFDRGEHPGKGKISWHWLSSKDCRLPVFFCSSSPSDRQATLLPQRVKENASVLRRILSGITFEPLPN